MYTIIPSVLSTVVVDCLDLVVWVSSSNNLNVINSHQLWVLPHVIYRAVAMRCWVDRCHGELVQTRGI